MDRRLSLYVSIGDDGGGPFALARGIINGLLDAAESRDLAIDLVIEGWPGSELESEQRQAHLLAGLRARQMDVRLVTRDRLLWIERDARHWVHPAATRDAVLSPFRDRLDVYVDNHPSPEAIGAADIVIGVVDPCVLAAGIKYGTSHQKRISVTDHTWDVTFRLILDQVGLLDPAALEIVHRIGALYAHADCLYMWPEPITPDMPFVAGARELGVDVRRLAGVLERPRRKRSEILDALQIEDINRALPVVCLSTGALGALEGVFRKLVGVYEQRPPSGYNVAIYAKVGSAKNPVFQPGKPMTQARLSGISLVDQAMAYDLLITRAGGGAVNAAIAAACPWASIIEPYHPQVNAIAEAARANGLATVIPYEVLEADPRRVAERELIEKRALYQKMRARLLELACGIETRLGEAIISHCAR